MYLLILESIGTAELLLVGIVALMIFGPRKLPEMMRKAGKLMAEFRKTTGEFKESWEKEVAMDFEEEKKLLLDEVKESENTIARDTLNEKNLSPEIKEINQDEFDFSFPQEEIGTEDQKDLSAKELKDKNKEPVMTKQIKKDTSDKRDWL